MDYQTRNNHCFDHDLPVLFFNLFFSKIKTKKNLNLEREGLVLTFINVFFLHCLELKKGQFCHFLLKKHIFCPFFLDVMELFFCYGEIALFFHHN